jgi:hypothetical protein
MYHFRQAVTYGCLHNNLKIYIISSLIFKISFHENETFIFEKKVADSFHYEVTGLFNSPDPSSRNMALGLNSPLTEMSTRNLLGDKRAAGA